MQGSNSPRPRLWNTKGKLASLGVAAACLAVLALLQFTGDFNPRYWPSWKNPLMMTLMITGLVALLIWKRLNRPGA